MQSIESADELLDFDRNCGADLGISGLRRIPFVCLNSSTQGFVGTSTESDCVEIVDANGTLGPRARVTTKDLNGVTTTLTN